MSVLQGREHPIRLVDNGLPGRVWHRRFANYAIDQPAAIVPGQPREAQNRDALYRAEPGRAAGPILQGEAELMEQRT